MYETCSLSKAVLFFLGNNTSFGLSFFKIRNTHLCSKAKEKKKQGGFNKHVPNVFWICQSYIIVKIIPATHVSISANKAKTSSPSNSVAQVKLLASDLSARTITSKQVWQLVRKRWKYQKTMKNLGNDKPFLLMELFRGILAFYVCSIMTFPRETLLFCKILTSWLCPVLSFSFPVMEPTLSQHWSCVQ